MQLQNVQNIRICRYKYSPEYAMYAGIDSNREETGTRYRKNHLTTTHSQLISCASAKSLRI